MVIRWATKKDILRLLLLYFPQNRTLLWLTHRTERKKNMGSDILWNSWNMISGGRKQKNYI